MLSLFVNTHIFLIRCFMLDKKYWNLNDKNSIVNFPSLNSSSNESHSSNHINYPLRNIQNPVKGSTFRITICSYGGRMYIEYFAVIFIRLGLLLTNPVVKSQRSKHIVVNKKKNLKGTRIVLKEDLTITNNNNNIIKIIRLNIKNVYLIDRQILNIYQFKKKY